MKPGASCFRGIRRLGSYVLLNGQRFQVIGVLQRIGHGNDMGDNTVIIMPYQHHEDEFPAAESGRDGGGDQLPELPADDTRETRRGAKQEVHKIVARNHGFDYRDPNSFDGFDTVLMLDQIGKIFTAMDMFLGSVGLVTLALGAIGIINIMLVAVADRTREIGLRKAVGATNRNIMFQFFVEGAFLTVMSGCIGMCGAWAVMAGLGQTAAAAGVQFAAAGAADGGAGDCFAGGGGNDCRTLSGEASGRADAGGRVAEGIGHDTRFVATSLRVHAARFAQDAAYHAGHGVGHRDGGSVAGLRRRLRAGDSGDLE